MFVIGGGGTELPEIGHSLRFNSADSAYCSRTPATATNRTLWTWSGWVKRTKFGEYHPLFVAEVDASNSFWLNFRDGDTLQINNRIGAIDHYMISNALFRDPSSHYHIVAVWDSNNATATDRARLYVNGVRLSIGSTIAFSSGELSIPNYTCLHKIGGPSTAMGSAYHDGYMSRVCFVDGTALTPSDFAYTDSNGQWRSKSANYCKAVVDAGGTNSFMLDFDDGANTTTLGNDYSSKNNDWTLTNFTRSAGVNDDWMEDTPTNNFCTLNPLAKATNHTTANSNLEVSNTNAVASSHIKSTINFDIETTSGIYWEVLTATNDASHGVVGLALATLTVTSSLSGTGGIYLTSAGAVVVNGSTVGTYIGWSDGALLAFWVSTGNLYYSVNGTAANSGNPVATNLTGVWCPAVGRASSSAVTCTYKLNFGQRAFNYTPPSGFKALCTKNLSTPTIAKPNIHFDVALWTGDGNTTKTVTGLNFELDFLWAKERDIVQQHVLVDRIRGITTNALASNDAVVEYTGTVYGNIQSTNINGFVATKGTDPTYSFFNKNTGTYVGWVWKANGTGISNTDGSITSTVSANQTAGFSIVTYTGTGANATVGHGLGVAPKMVIVKIRTGASYSWHIYHVSLPSAAYFLYLDTSSSQQNAYNPWNSTAPTSSVFSLNGTVAQVNTNTYTYVAYCFAEISGYSKFGSYTGNGSADGPFVWCGFRPKYVMIKRTDSIGGWRIGDALRSSYNIIQQRLWADLDAAEDSAQPWIDFLSNGFKLRVDGAAGEVNASGGTYIFAAFAEAPFKYSNAR